VQTQTKQHFHNFRTVRDSSENAATSEMLLAAAFHVLNFHEALENADHELMLITSCKI